MCGIAGIINFNNRPVDLETIFLMTEKVRHRGPDDEGIVLFDPNYTEAEKGVIQLSKNDANLNPSAIRLCNFNVALGHTRLSIIDLSDRGHQPMCSIDGNSWIVHNGEIYNYIEIKAELVSKGYLFKSNTDTEVILNSYQQWGAECLNKFNGMWAFAIWNRRERTLFCARDRFGIKPFYYFLNEKVFVFGSEIKQILQCIDYISRPNESAIYDYLVVSHENHLRETFFEEIYQLKSGEHAVLSLNNKSFATTRYYDLKSVKKTFCREHKYGERFRELFIDSVKLRLRSDVPVGSCLSGGMDSSAVVSVITTLLEGDRSSFNTFTACWADNKLDERKYSEEVVNFCGVNGNYIYPTREELADDLASLIWHQEEPFGTLSIFAQWAVMKAARSKGVTVLLDGQGGDEVFLGYERYYAWFLLELIRQKKVGKFIREGLKGIENSKLSWRDMFLFFIYFNSKQIRAFRLYQRAKHVVNSEFIKRYDISDRLNMIKGSSSVAGLQKLEIQDVQLPHLLRYADRNSMAFSIETRLPLLDYRLVEFGLSVPAEYLIRNGWTKNVMREGLKGIIPENIITRKEKVGFEVQQASLMKFVLSELYEKIDKGSILERYYNMPWLMDMLKKNNANNIAIWKALCLDLWYRKFFG
jgi:asparagine synthase (glutamine-hydrolysing)